MKKWEDGDGGELLQAMSKGEAPPLSNVRVQGFGLGFKAIELTPFL